MAKYTSRALVRLALTTSIIITLVASIVNAQDTMSKDSPHMVLLDTNKEARPSLPTMGIGYEETWSSGVSFLAWLKSEGIDPRIYYNLNSQDKELATEIYAGSRFYVLREATIGNTSEPSDESSDTTSTATKDAKDTTAKDAKKGGKKDFHSKGRLLEALIPISDELELSIRRSHGSYVIEIVRAVYKTYNATLALLINENPYTNIIKATHSKSLAKEFLLAYKNSINFKRNIMPDDKLVMMYSYKKRLNRIYGTPDLNAALITVSGARHYLFSYNGQYYDAKGNQVASFLLAAPLHSYKRISSRFSYGRYHPILKRVRAHFGVDFAAHYGTHIFAAANGRVIFAGRRGGYGKTVIIQHSDGLKTLYAHMSYIKKGIYSGRHVSRGTYIGNVGSTGLSTGPHLHFGVYKNRKPINPLGTIRTVKQRLAGTKKKDFLQQMEREKKRLDKIVEQDITGARLVSLPTNKLAS